MGGESKDHIKILDIKEILQILPHRYPFLLVDRVLRLDLENDIIIGQKNITINEPFFQGHFPEIPIMPGVLLLEAMAQTGGILIHQKGYDQKIALLMSVNHAKFRKPVVPGDVLHLHAHGKHIGNRAGRIEAKAVVNEITVAEAEIGFVLLDKSQM